MEKEKDNAKIRGKGIHSILVKILIVVCVSILISTILNLWTIIPLVRENMNDTNKNYMLDITESYGATLNQAWRVYHGRMYEVETLKKTLGNAGIEDVESSYAYLVDMNGTMLYHPTVEKIGEPVENAVVRGLVEKIAQGIIPEPDVIDYDFNGVTKFAAYYISEEAGFILVVTADQKEILEPLNKLIKHSAESAVIALVLCIIIGAAGAVIIIRPIKDVTKLVVRLEHLDFTADEKQQKLNNKKDETGDMSRALTEMRLKVAELLNSLQKQSGDLLRAAEALEQNSNETISTIGQVEQAVQDIAAGATSQADETQMATENVVSIGDMINTTAEEVNHLNQNTRVVAESSEQATSILNALGEINKKAIESVDIIYEQTNTTNESAQRIREATSLISSIAEETNLLSLNASIEAARAGEQGRGFAVVAAQIQKLAEQSNQSANQIEKIITLLLNDSAKAVNTMNEVKEIMMQQNDKVLAASATFDKVKAEIDSSIQGIGHIADTAKEMHTARSSVVDVVQNLTAIAEENAASTEETSASVSEISIIIENIAENAASLKQIAAELEENMQRFKI